MHWKKGQQIPRNQNKGAWECSWAQALLTEGGTEQTADTMESRSAPAHRGCVAWQGLLLAASLLTFWSLPTTAQLTVESVPPNAAEGKDVLFRVHNLPGNLMVCIWYKGETVHSNLRIASYTAGTQAVTLGPASSNRETMYPNGSLLFQKVTLQDTGYYTLQAIDKDAESKQVTGRLRVYPSLVTLWSLPTTAQLTIESVPPNAAEGKDVLLRVHNLPGDLMGYMWYKGEITDVDLQIVSYVIDTQTTTLGPAYRHRETIYPNGSLLFQKVTLQDTGYYTLQAIDKDFRSKRVTGQLRVFQPVGKPSLRASNATVTEHKDAVVLTCLTNDRGISIRWLFKNQILPHKHRMKLSQDNSILTIDPVRREDAGGFQCEVFNPISSSKSDPLELDVQYDPTLSSPGLSVGAMAGIVVGVLAGVALVAVLAYFLCIRKTGGSMKLHILC
ncbi:carcinoembryonic antigen-related cell adhesion molecule 10-like isoform X2 [Myotis daubentonii]|uniref:carcinoembryonic antigen-related cell adhesion molecule 10-like isoform X2 n=1 Tax=Myotis daubentonii TaxID=98922 RepID=UPI002872F7AB|nr:carcinoembryonic antigen-related cell adhesion molecule 10-like isoform X2 [Myotis daubentonii]